MILNTDKLLIYLYFFIRLWFLMLFLLLQLLLLILNVVWLKDMSLRRWSTRRLWKISVKIFYYPSPLPPSQISKNTQTETTSTTLPPSSRVSKWNEGVKKIDVQAGRATEFWAGWGAKDFYALFSNPHPCSRLCVQGRSQGVEWN